LLEISEKPYDSSYFETVNNRAAKAEKPKGKEASSDLLSCCEAYDKSPDWGFSIKVS